MHEEDELEEDVLEDILELDDEELIIYIFTCKISSYLCTVFILFTPVLSGRCKNNSQYKLNSREMASASDGVLERIRTGFSSEAELVNATEGEWLLAGMTTTLQNAWEAHRNIYKDCDTLAR